MFRKISAGLPRDPDVLVFWVSVVLSALFLLLVPGAPTGGVAL